MPRRRRQEGLDCGVDGKVAFARVQQPSARAFLRRLKAVKLGNAQLAATNKAAAAARDAVLEPLLREFAHLSSRDAAEELAKRGHDVTYKTVQRMRQRLGLV